MADQEQGVPAPNLPQPLHKQENRPTKQHQQHHVAPQARAPTA